MTGFAPIAKIIHDPSFRSLKKALRVAPRLSRTSFNQLNFVMQLSSPAIVLGKRDIGETDRIYSFLTYDLGKVTAVARGVRKPVSKLAGQLETLNFIDLSVMRNRGRGNVSAAVTESFFSRVKLNLFALQSAFLSVSAVDRLFDEGEPDREAFRLLLEYLRSLEIVGAIPSDGDATEDRRNEKIFILSNAFLWKILGLSGYRVEIRACAIGGEVLVSGDRYSFSPDAGGVVCSEHRPGARVLLPFSENAVKALRIFLSESLPLLPKLSIAPDARRELRKASSDFLEWRR